MKGAKAVAIGCVFWASGLGVAAAAPAAHAAPSAVGQCVYPKTQEKRGGGGLEFVRPIKIFAEPRDGAPSPKTLSTFESFSVKAQKEGFVQLATTPDYDAPDPEKGAGRVVGWGRLSDFVFQALRNCN